MERLVLKNGKVSRYTFKLLVCKEIYIEYKLVKIRIFIIYQQLMKSRLNILLILIISACAGPNTVQSEIVSKTPEEHYELGKLELNKKKYQEAKLHFYAAIKGNPNFYNAYNELSRCHKETGLIDSAIYCLRKAIEIEPTYYKSYNNLAFIYEKNFQNHDSALFYYSKAVEVDPLPIDQTDNAAFQNRGRLLFHLGRFEEAIADLSIAIQIDSLDGDLLNGRAIAYNETGAFKDALVDLERAIFLNPNKASYYYNKGVSLFNLKDYRSSIEATTLAISLDSEYSSSYSNRAQAYAEIGAIDSAFRDNDHAIGLDPQNAVAYLNRGFLFRKTTDMDKACEDWKMALKFGCYDAQNAINKYCR